MRVEHTVAVLSPTSNRRRTTMNRILIVGAGFAGMYAALSAARLRDEQGVSPDTLEIVVVAPEPRLVIRPRLYERAPETMVAPLAETVRGPRHPIRTGPGRRHRLRQQVGRDRRARRGAALAALRPPGAGGRQPRVQAGHPRPRQVRLQRRSARRRDRTRPPPQRPGEAAILCRPRHGGRRRRRLHRHRGRDRNAVAPARHPRADGKRPRHHRRPQRSHRAGDGPPSASADREGAARGRRGNQARRGRLGAERERRHPERRAVHRERDRDLGGRLPCESTHRASPG